MSESIASLLPLITGTIFVLALLLLLLSMRLFRRSRTNVFWRQRRQAGQRGWRLFGLSILLLAASGLSCGLTGLTLLLDNDEPTTLLATTAGLAASLTPPPIPTDTLVPTTDDYIPLVTETSFPATSSPTDAPIPSPTNTQPALETSTPPNTVVVIVTATPEFTPTMTVFPTFTPLATPVYVTITPLPYARLTIRALDDRISDTLGPVNPRQTFPAGTTRLYMFVDFRSMTEGVMWRRELIRDGVLVEEKTYLWGLEASGSGYFFFGDDNGFETGKYEVRVYIGTHTDPASSMTFTITS